MKRFIKTDDYYLDIQTDLKWAQEDHGFMSWEKSIKTVPKGWRLPSIGELHSIISFESEPRTQLPNIKSDFYWSSTIYYDSETSEACSIYFGKATNCWFKKDDECHVRYVKEI